MVIYLKLGLPPPLYFPSEGSHLEGRCPCFMQVIAECELAFVQPVHDSHPTFKPSCESQGKTLTWQFMLRSMIKMLPQCGNVEYSMIKHLLYQQPST